MAPIFRKPAQPAPEDQDAPPRRIRDMAVAVAIVLAAALLRLVFLPGLGMRVAFITFYPAIMLAALYGGLRAGVLATLLSAGIADWFWMEPAGSFYLSDPFDWLALAIFVASGLLIAWVAEQLRRTNARQRRDLEALVAERTDALTTEIAERKRTEAALRESEARHRDLTESIPAIIWIAKPDGVAIYHSRGWSDYTGQPPEVFGDGWKNVVHPDDVERVSARWDGSIATGETYAIEYRIRRACDGAYRWHLAKAVLRKDEHGGPVGWFGACFDIEDRKQAEAALRASEQRLQRLFASPLLGLVSWNMNGGIVDANDKFLEMVGYERADLAAGRLDWKQMTPPEFAHLGSQAELKATAATSTPFEKEYFRKDGSRLPVLAARATFEEATGDGVAFVIDISERKQAEQALALAKAEAERASVAKSKFLAAASHDLRQPVQSLTLLLNLIKGQVKDKPKTAGAVDMAKSAVDSLSGLLTGILDISKLDAGVVAPELASVNLGEIIDRLAKEYATRAAARGLTLRHVSPALRARTDAVLMERILRNLIENALRYTEKGSILIGLRLRGDKVRLDVVDTGIGIPADKQAEIFEEFRQLDNPARDASRGLGLGLAIVSRLAHLLGAPVEVASRVGRGARFSLLLPIDRSAAPAAGVAPALEGGGGRILVIEDDALIRQTYEMMLEDWGYLTLSAATGEEALDRAARANWEFDAIIADHRLGSGITGNAAATEIARRGGRCYPTVVVTGDTAQERLAEISASGFAMLHKPVEADDLLRTLKSSLGGAAGHHPTRRDEAPAVKVAT
jgi:PAS domain S-box-containing protein